MFLLGYYLLFAAFAYLIYYYFTTTFTYWKSRNIPGPQPLPIFGNYKDFTLRRATLPLIHQKIYDSYPDEKVVGFYRMTTRSLLIRDLDIIRDILIKDFEYFDDRGTDASDGLDTNLFFAPVHVWRPLRRLFTPLFTTGKLKSMMPLLNEKADAFLGRVRNSIENDREQNVYALMKSFTISSMLVCVFGFDVDPTSGPYASKLRELDSNYAIPRNYAQDLDLLLPGLLKHLKISLFSKKVNNIFLHLIHNALQAREGIPTARNDFIDLVLESKNQGDVLKMEKCRVTGKEIEGFQLSNEMIAAQAFVFYFAGYETTASLITFMMYELAMNPEVQDKLISEIDDYLTRHNRNISYDMVFELPYLDKVIKETLRRYPVSDLIRRAKVDYKIKGTNMVIEKGITVLVPVYGISYDDKYYRNPKKFDPENFSSENVKNRHPLALLTFGAGPRYCLGKTFAKLQCRVGVISFLSKFRVEASKKTPTTIELDPQRTLHTPGDLYLNIIPRKTE